MYYIPTRLFTGHNALNNNKEFLTGLGTKALIVTGSKSAKINGSFDDVAQILEDSGKEFSVYEGIQENPTVESIMEARDFGRDNGCDFVVGIGGGSALDASKAISLMMAHYNEGWEYLYDTNKSNDMLPLATVPTTCGTGSEVTGVSVLTRTDLKTKKSSVHKLYPNVSFVDGKYLKTAPRSILCNTAMDALSHMIEGTIHTKATPYTRMYASHGLDIWRSCKGVLDGTKEASEDDLQSLMDASTMAGMTIAQTGTTIPHALSYPITIGLNIPHGKSVSYFLAEFLKAMNKDDRDFILTKSGFSDPDELDEFFKKVCKPEEIPHDYREIAYEELCSNKAKLSCVPFEINDSILKRIAGI